MTISQLETTLATKTAAAESLLAKTSAECQAADRLMTEGERSAIKALVNQAVAVKAQITQAKGDEGIAEQIRSLTSTRTTAVGGQLSAGRGSIGEQFIQSAVFEWLKDTKNSRAGIWNSPAADLSATLLTSDPASGGDLLISDVRPGIVSLPTPARVVADLFAVGQTDGGSVTYMEETTFTNAADTVAEAAEKPESALVFNNVVAPVRKIAHWIPVTDELLSDAPALRAYIDARLRTGVQLALDNQLLNGTITPPDIVGVLNRTGLAAAQARGADNNPDAIAKQISAIFIAQQLLPDAIVMHPTNWLTIQLMKATDGQYYGNGPFAVPRTPTLWGLPVALSTNISAGTALVGAFKTAGMIFYKGGLRVDVSNSHASYFIENKIAIRAEIRASLAIFRPGAYGLVTGLS